MYEPLTVKPFRNGRSIFMLAVHESPWSVLVSRRASPILASFHSPSDAIVDIVSRTLARAMKPADQQIAARQFYY
jgi:hypothetical protein